MLNNLLNTFGILAPDELSFWDKEYALQLKEIPARSHVWVWIFQCYIQQCIEARNEWDWMLVSGQNYAPKVYDATVFVDGSEFLLNSEDSAPIALFTAYLQALSAQRTIAPNTTWQHFKGGIYTIKGQACHESVSGLSSDDFHRWSDSVQWLYRLEENPEIKLWLNYYKSGNFDYSLTEGSEIADHGERVFYIHDGIGYARKVDVFLGLVGPEHPEQEGLLRFAEVNDGTKAI